jgi:hypothetical protein
MKKLNDIPTRNEINNIIDRIKTLVTAIPENGVANISPQVNGIMVIKI